MKIEKSLNTNTPKTTKKIKRRWKRGQELKVAEWKSVPLNAVLAWPPKRKKKKLTTTIRDRERKKERNKHVELNFLVS